MKWTKKKIKMVPKSKLNPTRVCYKEVLMSDVIIAIGRAVFRILPIK